MLDDADGVCGFVNRTVDWGLTRKLLKNLGGTSQAITRLSNGNVESELGDAQLLHRVLSLCVGLKR